MSIHGILQDPPDTVVVAGEQNETPRHNAQNEKAQQRHGANMERFYSSFCRINEAADHQKSIQANDCNAKQGEKTQDKSLTEIDPKSVKKVLENRIFGVGAETECSIMKCRKGRADGDDGNAAELPAPY